MIDRPQRFFEENLEVLARQSPQLAQRLATIPDAPRLQVITSSSGDPVLIKNGVSLHSRRDPQAEAQSFVDSEQVRKMVSAGGIPVVFGLGLGYHVLALLGKFPRVVVYEPDIGVIRQALSHKDWGLFLPKVTMAADLADLAEELTEACALLVHRPSERLAPVDCARVRDMLEHTTKEKPPDDRWKILVVTPINGGSLPIARHAMRALKSLGHEVIEADLSPLDIFHQRAKQADITQSRRERIGSRLMNLAGEYLALLTEAERPHLLLALAQAPLDKRYLAGIRSRGVITAYWFVEDYRFKTYFREIASSYDFFFHIQGDTLNQELARLGSPHGHYLPLAADPDLFKPITDPQATAPFRAEVSFMGSGYPNRRHFFSELLDFDFKIWGTEWDLSGPLGKRVQVNGRRVTTEETVLIYNAAQVNLNLHSSIFSNGLDLDGHFINPRTFEIASCGAFQLVDERDPLPDFFTSGVELDTFRNLDDLRQKIDFYLSRPDLRQEFGTRAREKVLAEHTYQHRMKTMLAFIRSHTF
jgi:spore maturation protein CgeB